MPVYGYTARATQRWVALLHRKQLTMRQYKVEIQVDPIFCETCNEHHEYFICPTCSATLFTPGLSQNSFEVCDVCEDNFVIWQKGKKWLIVVACEDMYKYGWQIRCDNYSEGDDFPCLCQEGRCPRVIAEQAAQPT